MPQHIAIAGAGIAGLTSAIWLAQRGVAVTLFEHVSDPTPVGAGLLLQPSGQAVLKALNLLDTVRAQAAVVNSLQGYSGRWRTLNLQYRGLLAHYHGLGVHRANLHGVLWRRAIECGVSLKLGCAVQDFHTHNAGVLVQHQLGTASFDALVVANGTRSQLRAKLEITQRHRPYPWGAFWAVLDHTDWPFPDVLMQRYVGAHTMLGILPTGQNAIGNQRCYSLFWSVARSEFAHYRAQGLPLLVERIHDVWPEVAQWLASAPNTAIAIAEYADVRMSQWHQGRVVVIGDAAHAMSPQLGQGANMALVDATVLAQSLLREASITAALRHYSRLRARHLAYYRMASRFMTPLYQSRWPIGWLRDIGTVLGRHIAPVYRQYLLTLCGGKQGLFDGQGSIAKLLETDESQS